MKLGTRPLRLACGLLLLATAPAVFSAEEQAPDPDPEKVRAAVQNGLRILQKGTINYAKEQRCFTCHHQTLPMLAQATARKHGFKINEDLFQQQARFTHDKFKNRLGALRRGSGIGGRSMTVAYGLWALELAAWKPDEATDAMVTFLLKTQEENGRFFTNMSRPPLEDSPATSATIAAYFAQEFATGDQKPETAQCAAKARQWLLGFQSTRQEDFNSRLWGLHLLDADKDQIEAARAKVLESQRPDGGWAQLPAMQPDAYATGQALWTLQETGFAVSDPAYLRGIQYLLDTQLEDGSWLVKTRSKAIQKHFESGFPHGKDQFISVCATSWAVAALATTQPQLPPSPQPPAPNP